MSLTPLATDTLGVTRAALGSSVSPEDVVGSRQGVDTAAIRWALQALGAIAEKGEQVDAGSEKDGFVSREEIRAALAGGVFDGDPRKAAVEQLLNDSATLTHSVEGGNVSANGPLVPPPAALKEYRERLALHTSGARSDARPVARSVAERDLSRQSGAQSDVGSDSGGSRDGERGFWKMFPSEQRLNAENPTAVRRDFARDHIARSQPAAALTPRAALNGLTESAVGGALDSQPAGVFDLRPLDAAVSQLPSVQTPQSAAMPASGTGATVASSGADVARFREVVVRNFGFLDAASAGSAEAAEMARDGRVSAADIAAAAASQHLESADSEMLARLSTDPESFALLDSRDGVADGLINFSSAWRAATPGEQDLLKAGLASEIPDIRVANYSDRFFALHQSVAGGLSDARTALGGDVAGFNALDAIDGAVDGSVNLAGVALFGVDTKQKIFAAPANDGSGRPVLEVAIKAMGEDFAREPRLELPPDVAGDRPRAFRLAIALWDNIGKLSSDLPLSPPKLSFSRGDVTALAARSDVSGSDVASLTQLAQDPAVWNWLSTQVGGASSDRISYETLQNVITAFNKENFSGIMMAAGAVSNGVPMKTARFSGASFNEDMSADFASSQVFDPALALKAYSRLMGDTNIQQVLSANVRELTPNAPTQARQLFSEMTSRYYLDSLKYVETLPDGRALAEQRLGTDLAALSTLDSNLAQQASDILLGGQLLAELERSTPSAVPPDQMLLATRDFLMSLSLDMRSARGFLRIPGLLAGHDAGWKQIGALIKNWPSQKIENLASALSEALIKADQGARAVGVVGIPSAAGVANAASKTALDASEAVRSATTTAERTRLQALAERAATGARDLKDFIAACEKNGVWASMAGGISIASGVYKLVKGGENIKGDSWGRLSIANDFVLASCFVPGYINLTNWVLSRFNQGFSLPQLGLAPNQTFGNLVKAVWTGDTAAVGTGLAGSTVGMAIKGLTGGSLLAAGSIGGAMGIKQVVDGVRTGEEFDIGAGALNIAMGASWAASGAAYLMASAMTGPLIGIGCAFGLVSVFLSTFGPQPDQQFADRFEQKVGSFADAGVLRDGWRDSVRGWFRDNQAPSPDSKSPGYSGMGLDL